MNTVLARLFRLFFHRFFETESAEELRIGIGGVFAILALPATLMCFVLLEKYSALSRYFRRIHGFDNQVESLPDKYLFIAFCMAITGLIAFLRWDTLFQLRGRNLINQLNANVQNNKPSTWVLTGSSVLQPFDGYLLRLNGALAPVLAANVGTGATTATANALGTLPSTASNAPRTRR